MLKAIIQYNNALNDGKIVFRKLTSYNLRILKSKRISAMYEYRITFLIDNYAELNDLVYDLNCNTRYGVLLVKIKQLNNIWERIFNKYEKTNKKRCI